MSKRYTVSLNDAVSLHIDAAKRSASRIVEDALIQYFKLDPSTLEPLKPMAQPKPEPAKDAAPSKPGPKPVAQPKPQPYYEHQPFNEADACKPAPAAPVSTYPEFVEPSPAWTPAHIAEMQRLYDSPIEADWQTGMWRVYEYLNGGLKLGGQHTLQRAMIEAAGLDPNEPAALDDEGGAE